MILISDVDGIWQEIPRIPQGEPCPDLLVMPKYKGAGPKSLFKKPIEGSRLVLSKSRTRLSENNMIKSSYKSSTQLSKSASRVNLDKRHYNKGIGGKAVEDGKYRYGKTGSRKHDAHHKLTEEDIVKSWYNYHVWKQRTDAMKNPDVGWAPHSEISSKKSAIWDDDIKAQALKKEWIEYLNKEEYALSGTELNIFINTCVLLAIKQFVFDW